jgi:hypothetical protein
MKKFIIPILYLVSILTVLATNFIVGYEDFLENMTIENGFFETISVVMLFAISLYGIRCYIKSRDSFSRLALFFIISFSLLAFVAGMEEISWGQSILHFQSSSYFLEQNIQQETNLHNLIDGNLFSSIIYTMIYILFVFIPLFYKLFFPLKILRYFDIDPHTILISLFASVFQLYFYNDIGVLVDMITHLLALFLFAYFIWSRGSSFWLQVHFLAIIVATILSMWCCEIYRFDNMQYEIRESFVVLSALLIFIELVRREKSKKRTLFKL